MTAYVAPPTKKDVEKAFDKLGAMIYQHITDKATADRVYAQMAQIEDMTNAFHSDVLDTWQWSLSEQINDLDRSAAYTNDPTIRHYTDAIVSNLTDLVTDLSA